MRRHVVKLLCLSLVVSACAQDPSGATPADQESLSLVPDYAESMATALDGAGIGAAGFPAELALTTEQKAAIAGLHEAFKAATAADMTALRAIEAEARAAVNAGKSRDEVHAILARGVPILIRVGVGFALLQAAILEVYTPDQRAWVLAHRPKPCGPAGPPRLTDEQIHKIRELQQAFMLVVKDDIALIRRVTEAAHQAAQNGASRERVAEILHEADAAKLRVREAESRLQAAIDEILTPEQRAARCLPAPKRP